ncbi:hypothetical protein HAP47_0000335 [Bradyrhizobium sp. 41S5]|uniref:hypothetical protein n=1 Tax=Bradyrhizobium sp. 41S5 TaxID=1404443 RepID=UPI00156AAAB4|nr:hypothetical protein [Bradyrhizobium sp. 41S5]UFX45225.1 hypothetical protein HAP47_0000335 [Bradyrhizobium sp. 41S5]
MSRHHWYDLTDVAVERFAKANGWHVGKQFGFALLSRNRAHYGRSHDREPWQRPPYCDHADYFRLGRSPVAIVAHNYVGDAYNLPRHVEKLNEGTVAEWWMQPRGGGGFKYTGSKLVVHVPPAGKAASWYFPLGTLPMCVTRDDIKQVIWPTAKEMAEMTEAYELKSPGNIARHQRELDAEIEALM